MSEEFTEEHKKLYQYAGNSNLVLPSDRSKGARRGERGKDMESLWGRIDPHEMGGRVHREVPKQTASSKQKEKEESEILQAQERKRNRREQRALRTNYGYSNILAATEDIEGMYRPRTQETRRIWELILSQSRQYLGDQAPEVLMSAADETLSLLKNDELKESDKKKQIESVFGAKINEAEFSRYIQLARQITDYNMEEEEGGGATGASALEDVGEESGVAVVFGGSDDEDEEAIGGRDDGPTNYVVDSAESDEESDEDAARVQIGPTLADAEGADEAAHDSEGDDEAGGYRTVIHGYSEKNAKKLNKRNEERAKISALAAAEATTVSFGARDADAMDTDEKSTVSGDEQEIPGSLNARSIDAFWLQRQVGKHHTDPVVVQEKTRDATRLLSNRKIALGELENDLAELFDYEHFDTVQTLVSNRDTIVWCMRLARAEAEDDREQLESIHEEMRELGLSWIIAVRSGEERKDAAAQATRKGSLAKPESESVGEAKGSEPKATPAEPTTYTPAQSINLADLAFAQGGHLMTNEKWIPPKGAVKTVMNGYEEIRVPAPEKLPPPGDDEPTVHVNSLPEWAQAAFSGHPELNRIQSRVYPVAFESDDNMLICAPTGAGKTNCAALTMLRTIGQFRDPASGHIDLDSFKMVYIAPMKALVAEMAGSFGKRLAPLGLKVAELTGDSQLTKQQITETHLIVTTPEKWDVITRKGGEGSYTALVRLVIIDEIHLLHDDRGPVLESLVCRLLRTQEQTQEKVRLVGLSATLPNYEDVAAFLRVPRDRGLFHFDARYRPCPLQQEFVGITEKKHIKRLERMDQVCYDKIKRHGGQSQVLVFVHSRKETVRTAQRLRDMAVEEGQIDIFVKAGSATSEILREEAEATKDKGLRDLLPFGFGCHHAGMSRADRRLIEDLFADGHVKVLVSTATLAWGVNLPAHTVIIKGTQVYNPEKGCWIELSPQDVLQMLGRAGRPQYDTFGEGVIITAHSELRYYLSLMNQQLPIESQLVSRLADSLNAEVALGSVRSRDDAVEWLGYTYLYVRMLRSPEVYDVRRSDLDDDPALAVRRADLAHAAAVELERCFMVRYDRKTGRLQPTELGRVASHFYISHRSMAVYQQDLRADASDIDMLRVFSLSDEFRLIPVRIEERVELQRLLERVPIPMRETADSPSAKINVLLQAYIAQLGLSGFALVSDMVYVTQSAGRIFRALFELCVRRGWARAARRALDWCKQVERRMWLAMSPLRQFGRDCPPDLVRAVERKPFPWSRYLDLNEQELGELVGSPKAGRMLHSLVHLVPRLEVSAHVQPLTRSLLRFELRVTPDFQWNDALHGAAEQFWIWVEDGDGDTLLHSEVFVLKRAYASQEHIMEFTCALTEPLPPQYFVSVTSDRWIGAETRVAVSFKHLQLPDKAFPPTELLDMQPLAVADLRAPEFEAVYNEHPGSPLRRTGKFNAIQTQAFHTLYGTDDSALVAASPGSGKTLAAELALLRFFKQEAVRAHEEGESFVRRRAVYIAPFAALVKTRAHDWRNRFGSLQGGKNVAVLSGDTAADLRRIENAHIVLSTPGPWDGLSRRWRQRQRHGVREIGLFIADELQWVGGAGLGSSADDLVSSGADAGDDAGADTVGDQLASTYEVIVSRVRYMATQLERPIRIVALSVPLLNARDIAAWIGAPQPAVFNFHPAVRPVPLEIHIQTTTVAHFASRMAALAAPTYRAVCGDPVGTKRKRFAQAASDEYAMDVDNASVLVVDEESQRPAIVFVSSRRQCRAVAGELLTQAAADGVPLRFVHGEVEPSASKVSDRALREFLAHGVGYYHEALSTNDRRAVLSLFASGAIQVLVASRETCWALDAVHAHTVVIMGAERYNGREHRYTDYSMPDVLQMIGRASRPGIDQQGLCVLMCMANKREVYKKFLYEPLPIESRLDTQLHDPMNSEVVAKTITSKQDAVDYLTWTLMYRRLVQNPNYYGLQGTTHQHLSDYLSELIESTLNDLVAAKCVEMDDEELGVAPTNLGMIAAYYQIRYLTVEMFALSLSAKTKLRGVLDIVSAADEFEALPIRHREAGLLSRVANRVPVALPSTGNDMLWHSPRVRTHLLLQAHFSRLSLPADLAADQAWVLARVVPLLQAMVDVSSSMGWLAPALASMELSQMAVQAVWEGRDPLVKQVPHLGTEQRLRMCREMQVESVFDVMDMEDDGRAKLLDGLSAKQIGDVAAYVNRYPNIEIEHEIQDADEITEGASVVVRVSLDREWDDESEVSSVPGAVAAPFFPYSRAEGWWIVIGDTRTQTLATVKRISVGKQLTADVEFAAPETQGEYAYKMYLMCDAYLGCDQEFDLAFTVLPDEDADDSDESV
ncbi:Pre-mRNA splicing [Coemansia sp. RSA 1813]|nr:Pre-mRNA-splicing helicase BRR2 [Coemansia sp. RSA 1646]KAJ1768235.1 Pre-mRNA splicing [Coemansia sp. RSA 1843]KAJ2088716.1 Pre-mRNA splicing [Coemansia sp. RSA 986]KAJ2213665.1 Pre-mRNA splicing [Coemansia sp. RSA 487]KAJ2568618.1 Pre-mRNA splicing [Coemansia sp. RSA 1813]